ncbi:hypothetical protein SAMN04488103_11186 [Gemmobacter aquatilis]|uniref:Uncharacterized protein n=1 Tax=Gemmobacter aquatilis TaxID=933059 RepID=A0A1H8LPL8_9RHOB|nr:DUF6522 family protein [Gemmobacter aquatilis]SEO06963.1 hypothetical protein SAMN04488103_11186 [Gemmobacter aquatilis]
MTQVERDGSDFVVSAPLLVQAFKVTEDGIRQAIRDCSLTSICEAGVDADARRWRLTFRHAGRACRFTVDEAGTILSTSRFPVRARSSATPD